MKLKEKGSKGKKVKIDKLKVETERVEEKTAKQLKEIKGGAKTSLDEAFIRRLR